MIEVRAGPDTFQFEYDRYYWTMWIKENVTRVGFTVNAHPTDAYKAIVTFKDPKWEIIFQLTAPEYIHSSLITLQEQWYLGMNGPGIDF
jgi:hypothetical protein